MKTEKRENKTKSQNGSSLAESIFCEKSQSASICEPWQLIRQAASISAQRPGWKRVMNRCVCSSSAPLQRKDY